MKQINSSDNPLIKHLTKLVKDRDYRYQEERLVIEGVTMVREAAAHTTLHKILAVDESLFPPAKEAEQILVPLYLIEKISGSKSPEGILAEVSLPQQGNFINARRLLVLDKIADPGNLGTLIRTALALGWDGVYLVAGCCDPFNDKSLRAAKGATFQLPLHQGSWEKLKKLIHWQEWQVLGADMQGKHVEQIEPGAKRILILGNESQGLSPEAKALSSAVTIPIQKIDSLNVAVAGGILMAQLAKDG